MPTTPELFGKDLFGGSMKKTLGTGPLYDKFLFPPFTVLDTKQGEWQDRRRAWLKVGFTSGEGRAENLTFNTKGTMKGAEDFHDTSVFDPVICELTYRWFCPEAGQVVDPFCGGSVRGGVASLMGLNYWGCEIRQEQVDANISQVESMELKGDIHFACGDSYDLVKGAPLADLIFSCPPYGDLERYSDNPRDLSTMDYGSFMHRYRAIIQDAAHRLKSNRFAVFVVGDYRDKAGHYHGFISDTVDAFERCGMRLYNDAVILQALSTAGLRADKQFVSGRKLVKVHQNYLVFCKGDWKQAAAACRAEPT